MDHLNWPGNHVVWKTSVLELCINYSLTEIKGCFSNLLVLSKFENTYVTGCNRGQTYLVMEDPFMIQVPNIHKLLLSLGTMLEIEI